VEGQPAPTVQDEVVVGVERDWLRAGQPQLTRALDLGGSNRSAVGVGGFWILTIQPQSTAL